MGFTYQIFVQFLFVNSIVGLLDFCCYVLVIYTPSLGGRFKCYPLWNLHQKPVPSFEYKRMRSLY